MDDYFINREDTPVDENGKRDYENTTVLILHSLTRTLMHLLPEKQLSFRAITL